MSSFCFWSRRIRTLWRCGSNLAGSCAWKFLTPILLLTFAGCGESAPEAEPILSASEIAEATPEVFGDADAETRELANATAAAVESEDLSKAWGSLQELGGRPGLTDAQREFIARSEASVGAQLNKAAEAGDASARQLLELHRAHK